MPLLILLVVPLIALAVAVVLMPVGLVQRYRAGTARRQARAWLAGLNLAALLFSVFLFVGGAAITSVWVPKAFGYSLLGLACGALLGALGLALTRWEGAPGGLHYTPNRYLTLGIILLVIARLAYGLWRIFQGWSFDAHDRAWLRESGVPGSLAAGAVVLGYSLAYWVGILGQALRHRQQTRVEGRMGRS